MFRRPNLTIAIKKMITFMAFSRGATEVTMGVGGEI